MSKTDDELRAIVRELLMYLANEDGGWRDPKDAKRVLAALRDRLD